MIIQKKPDYLIFADSAKKGENAEFPDVGRGWGITIDQTASKPPMEWMNGAFNRIDKNMLYLLQQGVPEWSEKVTYPVNAIIKYSGVLYTAIAENENSIPTTSTTKWKKTQADISNASITQNGIVKLSSSINSQSETEAATSLAVKKANDNATSANNNANNAHDKINAITDKFEISTNESRVYSNNKKTYLLVRDDGIIAAYNTEKNKMVWGFDAQGDLGVGTVHSNHVVGLSEHVTHMFNQSFEPHGYTRLPNGLIIQWGIANSLGSDAKNGTLQSFFIAFPRACFSVVTSDIGSGVNPTAASPVSNFQFRCWGKTPINGAPYSNTSMFYIAIGF